MTEQRRSDRQRARRRIGGQAIRDARRDARNGAVSNGLSDPGGVRGLLTSRQRSRAEAAAAHAEEQRAVSREMGDRLRDARTALALSLAEAERDTRINRLYLEALEAGQFEALPAPVYARGFMRSYARYLGLDPEEAVQAVPRDLPRPAGLEPLAGLRRMRPPGLAAAQLNLPVILVATLAALAVVAAVVLVPRLGGGDGIDLPLRGGAPGATPVATSTPPAGAESPPPDATVPPFAPGTVPNFNGVQRDEAVRVLEDAGLTPLIFEAPNQAPAGSVFQQSPPPGEAIEEGGTVTLFVSQGPGE